MKVSEFDYCLPAELIAQSPLEPRDASRLLVVERASQKVIHRHFRDIKDYLLPGDCLVANDARVLPARIRGFKADTQAKVEVLLLRNLSNDCWEVLLRHAGRVKEGTEIIFAEERLTGTVQKRLSTEGTAVIKFRYRGASFLRVLNGLGEVPLPPYIHEPLEDAERYQTIFARKEGAVAAPTAGLHFTLDLMEEIARRGCRFVFVTLNVGMDTFQPVRSEEVEEHRIHREWFRISSKAAQTTSEAIESGGRVVAVGTTSVRVLETAAVGAPSGKYVLEAKEGWTDLFVYPGYKFKVVDALLTNFHLPKSTLLMLVYAFAGAELAKCVYQEAMRAGYRFFSFGDCMLIL